jgi:hypothetical protein
MESVQDEGPEAQNPGVLGPGPTTQPRPALRPRSESSWPAQQHEERMKRLRQGIARSFQRENEMEAHKRYRRRVSIIFWIFIILLVLLGAGLAWPSVHSLLYRSSTTESTTTTTPSSTDFAWRETLLIILNAFASWFGTYHLSVAGISSLISLLPKNSRARMNFARRVDWFIVDGQWITFATLPLFTAYTYSCIAPDIRCDPKDNIYLHLPIRKKDDFRQVAGIWWKHAQALFQGGFGPTQLLRNLPLTSGNLFAFGVSGVIVSAAKVWVGPCWEARVLRSIFIPIISFCTAMWVGATWKALLRKANFAHLQLVLYVWVLYLAWRIPARETCANPKCW